MGILMVIFFANTFVLTIQSTVCITVTVKESRAFSCMILKLSIFSSPLFLLCLGLINVCLIIRQCCHPTIEAVYAKLRYIYFLTSWIKLNPNYHFERNVLSQKTHETVLIKRFLKQIYLWVFLLFLFYLWVVRRLNWSMFSNNKVFDWILTM